MQKMIFCSLSVMTFLTGCQNVQDTGWRSDCEQYSSYDKREYDQCLKRNPNRKASSVSVDPGDLNRTAEQDLGKGNH